VTIEASDVVFAVDSIPAVFGVTTDTFIVFTSNIFAILGLRALYFLLAGIMDLFHYLKVGLSLVLCFVGLKMMIHNYVHISSLVSLSVIGSTLGLSIAASMLFPPPVSEGAGAEPAEAVGEPPASAPEG
jgi:tellurite resistance protein TerC